jgi:hypothetical protein
LAYIDAFIKTKQLKSVKSLLSQSKKLSLAGEKFYALEDKLTQFALSQESKKT